MTKMDYWTIAHILPLQIQFGFYSFSSYIGKVYKVSNNALTSLLRFLKYFVCMVGRAFGSPHLEEFSRQVPISLKDAYSRCGIASREFIEYVVCPCCHSVYEYEDCIQSVGGEIISKCCCHVSYPNQPQPSRRQHNVCSN